MTDNDGRISERRTRRDFIRIGGVAALASFAPAIPLGPATAVAATAVRADSFPRTLAPTAVPGSLSDCIRKFHLFAQPRDVNLTEIADGLGMAGNVSLREVYRRLTAIPTEITQSAEITTDTALGGQATMTLRSDGTYISSGHMHASGVPSFEYRVTVTMNSNGGRFMPMAVHQGHVFGTDTPGDRTRTWNETGQNENPRQNWLSLAENATMQVNKQYGLAGVLGTLADVGVKLGEFVGLAAVSNPALAATVASGVLLIFGPAAIVPAIVTGGASELAVGALGLLHRQINEAEYAFAEKIFGVGTLPPRENIILTNALGLPKKGIPRPFTTPSVGGVYFVNLGGAAYANPMGSTGRKRYKEPGRLLIHELSHTWQAKRYPACTYFCKAATDSSYFTGSDVGKPWSSKGLEQQATIIDTWYGSLFPPDPNNPDPTNPIPTVTPSAEYSERNARNADFLKNEFPKSSPDFSKRAPHMFDRYMYGNVRAGLN